MLPRMPGRDKPMEFSEPEKRNPPIFQMLESARDNVDDVQTCPEDIQRKGLHTGFETFTQDKLSPTLAHKRVVYEVQSVL